MGVVALCAGLLGLGAGSGSGESSEGGVLRVGVYDNPPLVYESDVEPAGLAVEVLQEIARLEGWRLEYRSCVWIDCLDWLGTSRLDVLVGIAHSRDRARRFRFTRETLISNFGVVYSGAESVESLLDLEGKRVAVMSGNIHAVAFEAMMRSFDVACELRPVRDFHEVMRQVEAGEVDAGVVNRLFSLENGRDYRALETGIVFNPIEIRYAMPRDAEAGLLEAIDRRLAELKADPDSVYYAALDRSFGHRAEGALPGWLLPVGAGGLGALTLAILGTALLRRQVKIQTRELRSQSRRLEREVRERRKAEEELNRLAFFDSLTGLPNRLLFRDRLRQALGEARRAGGKVAVVFLDLDRFKQVNDTFGHSVGDELMRRIAGRLGAELDETDTIGRVGGDEFVVLLPNLPGPERAARVARRLLETFGRPFPLDETQVVVTASLGSAIFPDDADEAEGLVGCADVAMYHAKSKGRAGYRAYERVMASEASRRLTVDRDLRTAIAYENLLLEFQPILDLASGRVVAAEALARIVDREGRNVLPDRFIAVAEESGLIHRFGAMVLERACAEARPWCVDGDHEIRLCVNVSPHQLEDREFTRRIDRALERTGFPPRLLELELTEGVFLDRLPAQGTILDRLRGRGIRLSIDDFGTGYSSLSYLSRLPLDALKIDQSFVQRSGEDRGAAEIIAAIVRMTRGLGLVAIAEGIETEDQLAFLREQGCPFGQGYLMSPPLPAAELERWLRGGRDSGARGAR